MKNVQEKEKKEKGEGKKRPKILGPPRQNTLKTHLSIYSQNLCREKGKRKGGREKEEEGGREQGKPFEADSYHSPACFSSPVRKGGGGKRGGKKKERKRVIYLRFEFRVQRPVQGRRHCPFAKEGERGRKKKGKGRKETSIPFLFLFSWEEAFPSARVARRALMILSYLAAFVTIPKEGTEKRRRGGGFCFPRCN